jgi:hypothetical protein
VHHDSGSGPGRPSHILPILLDHGGTSLCQQLSTDRCIVDAVTNNDLWPGAPARTRDNGDMPWDMRNTSRPHQERGESIHASPNNNMYPEQQSNNTTTINTKKSTASVFSRKLCDIDVDDRRFWHAVVIGARRFAFRRIRATEKLAVHEESS